MCLSTTFHIDTWHSSVAVVVAVVVLAVDAVAVDDDHGNDVDVL